MWWHARCEHDSPMGDGSAERWRRATRVTRRIAAQDGAPTQAVSVGSGDLTADDTLRLVHSQPRVRRPRSSREHGTLLVVQGAMAGHLHAVSSSQPTMLGRGEEADLQVGDDSVSRTHARIHPSGGCYFLQDMGSANGTFVNGQLVQRSHQLESGDTISLGAATMLRFDLYSLREQQALFDLERSAVRDPLTGLLNRRHFQERLAAEVAFASRRGHRQRRRGRPVAPGSRYRRSADRSGGRGPVRSQTRRTEPGVLPHLNEVIRMRRKASGQPHAGSQPSRPRR
jgi:hypothetical protein